MTAPQPPATRVMRARKNSVCATCGHQIRAGQQICRQAAGWSHIGCVLAQRGLSTDSRWPGGRL